MQTWSGNTFYANPSLAQWGYGPAGGAPSPYSYGGWLAATGLTNPGTAVNAIPPDKIVVRPNAFEPGRANIAVFNWSNAPTVNVDLSNVLPVGQAFTIVNVQDFYGAPVASGTYAGGTVSLPMTGILAPIAGGSGVRGPTTGPTFNAFVVSKAP